MSIYTILPGYWTTTDLMVDCSVYRLCQFNSFLIIVWPLPLCVTASLTTVLFLFVLLLIAFVGHVIHPSLEENPSSMNYNACMQLCFSKHAWSLYFFFLFSSLLHISAIVFCQEHEMHAQILGQQSISKIYCKRERYIAWTNMVTMVV